VACHSLRSKKSFVIDSLVVDVIQCRISMNFGYAADTECFEKFEEDYRSQLPVISC
jgi:hypothetical protein